MQHEKAMQEYRERNKQENNNNNNNNNNSSSSSSDNNKINNNTEKSNLNITIDDKAKQELDDFYGSDDSD